MAPSSDRGQPEAATLAGHDEITGLPMRRLFLERIDAALEEASPRGRRRLWVGVLALPHLRYVTATLGFEAGDELLCEIAGLIRRELPELLVLGRIGGDLALASFGLPRRLSLRSTDREVRQLGEVFEASGVPLFTPITGGAAMYRPGDDAAGLVRKAQLALLETRAEGSGDLRFYSDEMAEREARRTEIGSALIDAIDSDALHLCYQPKVALDSGAVVGAEALVRWPLGEGRFVSPAEFVPVAESSGLVVRLGEWVLREACDQALRWTEAGVPRFQVAVNVSPIQLHKSDVPALLRHLLATRGLEPRLLELELTEGAVMSEGPGAVEALAALRETGVELAIDDFGTGYSSLSYLRRFPVQRLKIDQSFLRGADHSPQDLGIVRSVVAIGHNLGLRVLAEGVESAAHVEFLCSEDCDEAQGHYFAPALEPDALIDFVRERAA